MQIHAELDAPERRMPPMMAHGCAGTTKLESPPVVRSDPTGLGAQASSSSVLFGTLGEIAVDRLDDTTDGEGVL